MADVKNSLITKIAIMYYEKNMKQEDIARATALSKAKVSRLIQKARQTGVVKIKVNKPVETNRQLEAQLMKLFLLRDAMVVTDPGSDNLLDQLGKAAAFYLDMFLKDNDILGVSVGETVSRIPDYLKPQKLHNLRVVQLIGGFGDVIYSNPLNIITKISERLKARGTYANVPVVVESEDLKKRLMQSETMQPVLKLWSECNIAIMSIGTVGSSSLFLKTGVTSHLDMKRVKNLGGVGDILGHFFNKRGKLLDWEPNRRLITMPFDQINGVERLIVVAGGEHKIEAIKGGLNTECIDVLITDDLTANKLI
jgi:deoxyribonucleoside regulator